MTQTQASRIYLISFGKYNHNFSLGWRLDDFYIEASNNSNGNSAQQCAEESEQFTDAETRVYTCPSGVRGRYVRIRFDESENGILQLCEVQVQSGTFQFISEHNLEIIYGKNKSKKNTTAWMKRDDEDFLLL